MQAFLSHLCKKRAGRTLDLIASSELKDNKRMLRTVGWACCALLLNATLLTTAAPNKTLKAVVAFAPVQSHWAYVHNVALELAARGHELKVDGICISG